MKNNRRLIARIGAVIAVVLMVGALVVPCFADSYNNIHQAFYKMLDPRAMNFALLQTTEYYAQFSDERFFTYKTLVTGEMNTYQTTKNFTYYRTQWSSDSGTWQSVIPLDTFVACFYLSDEEYIMDSPIHYIFGINGRLVLDMSKGQDYSEGYLTLRFYSAGNNTVNPDFSMFFYLTFTSTQIIGVLNTIYVADVSYDPSVFYKSSIAFVPTQLSENIPLAMAVDALFENPYSVETYTNFVYSPYDFRQGFHAGFGDSYQTGLDEGYDMGYEDGEINGYAGGYKEGYTIGYDAGKVDSGSYQDGYNAGIATINDGEFGRNFLSGIFTAPLDALERFTLVSWTTADNTVISINLMQILSGIVGLSLFVWFLKMFAGG